MTKFDIWYLLIIIDLFTIIFLIYTTDLSYTKKHPNKSIHKPYPSSTQYSNWKKKLSSPHKMNQEIKRKHNSIFHHIFISNTIKNTAILLSRILARLLW